MWGVKKLLTCGKKGPITYIGSQSTLVTSASNTVTVNVPSGSNPGDLMIFILQMTESRSDTVRLTPTDGAWVQYQSVVSDEGRQLRTFTRKLGSGETSFTATTDSGLIGSRLVATILTYRNAVPHLGAHGLYAGITGFTGSMAFPSLDPTKDGVLLCVGHTNGSSIAALSTPSGMSLLMSNSPLTTDIGTSVFTEDRTAGATGTRTTTMAANLFGYALGVPMFLING